MSVRLVPNSAGSPLREFNPCHNPGGSEAGGRFSTKGNGVCQGGFATTGSSGSASSDSDGSSVRYPTELDTDPMDKTLGHNVSSVDNSADDDAIEEVFGQNIDVERLAQGMVQGTNVEWSVEISSEGGGGNDNDNYVDPSDYEDLYGDAYRRYKEQAQEAAYEQTGEQESSDFQEFKDKFLSDAEDRHGEIAAIFAEVRGSLDGPYGDTSEIPLLPGVKPPFGRMDVGDVDEENFVLGAYQAAGFDEDEPWSRLTDTMKGKVRSYFETHPETYASEAFPDFDADWAKSQNRYLEDEDRGFDRWRDDHNAEPDFDSIKSLDDWVENEYGPFDSEPSSGGGDSSVKFKFESPSGDFIERTFNQDGGLHVHHDYLRLDHSPPGTGKELFRGMVREYEHLGVDRVSVYAALSTGGYAWGKYGFAPDSNSHFENSWGTRFDRLSPGDEVSYSDSRRVVGRDGKVTTEKRTVSKKITEAEIRTLKTHVADWAGKESFWDTIETKFPGAKSDKGKSTTFNVGKWLLLGNGWHGTIDMHDAAQVKRLHTYIDAVTRKYKKKSAK